MHVKDFDRSGFVEQVVSTYSNGVSYPLPLRDDLTDALPFLRSRLPTYSDYAHKTLDQIFTPTELSDAVLRRAYTFATSLVRNNGDGSFTLTPLPIEAQVAPVYAILAEDFSGDGRTDLLLAGNFDGFQPEIGRASSGFGVALLSDGKGGFAALGARESGFFVPGQARDIQRIKIGGAPSYVVSRNNDRPIVFRRSDSR
jgi:hypothetical protein